MEHDFLGLSNTNTNREPTGFARVNGNQPKLIFHLWTLHQGLWSGQRPTTTMALMNLTNTTVHNPYDSFSKLLLIVWVARRPITRILESSLLFSLIIGRLSLKAHTKPEFHKHNWTRHLVHTRPCVFFNNNCSTSASRYEMKNTQRGALLRVGYEQFSFTKKLLAAII